jgi:flagellar biosynthesis protein FlhG
MEEFIKKKIEGTKLNLFDMIKELSNSSPASLVTAKTLASRFYPRVILNKVEEEDDLIMANKFVEIVRKNIGLPVEFIGYIESEDHLREAINTRVPHIVRQPDSIFKNHLEFILKSIEEAPEVGAPYLYDDLDDMQERQMKFLSSRNSEIIEDRRKVK